MSGLLDGKVVVISGVGPALGTTLARRCAGAGADLVLAARTVDRLDDLAKEVAGMGRRAVAVGTDITDQDQVDNLVREALAAYGKVDVLINNAFPFACSPKRSRSVGNPLPASSSGASTFASSGVFASATAPR